MSKALDKNNALQEFGEKYVLDQFAQEVLAIEERYKKKKEGIEKELFTTFDALCQNAIRLQAQGKKGNIQYIYISFLRTSIMENTSFYRMDAYDENWFLDKEECTALWNADFIFQSLFTHMEKLEEKKKEYVRKVTSMDIDEIKLQEAVKYHMITVEFIRAMAPKLIEIESYKEMGKTAELRILAGEYMDQSEILYGKKVVEE